MLLFLKAWIKKAFSDIHAALISIAVLSILGLGGTSLLSEKMWLLVKNTMLSPMPLWLAIVLVLSISIMVYLITKKYHSYKNLKPNKPKIQKLNNSTEQVLLTFFEEGNNLSVLHFERLCLTQGINGAQYYLDELVKDDYIRISSGDHDPNVTYIISSKGRKYVMENLLKYIKL